MENFLEDAVPAEDSGIRMALFEHDQQEKRTEAVIDTNGNLLLTVTLPPMSYTYYVCYAVDDMPEDPIRIPAGKPFGSKLEE